MTNRPNPPEITSAPPLLHHFQGHDLYPCEIRLPNDRIYLRLMIDGEPSKPFSATTLSRQDLGNTAAAEDIRALSTMRPDAPQDTRQKLTL
jgi:hypothetical protein